VATRRSLLGHAVALAASIALPRAFAAAPFERATVPGGSFTLLTGGGGNVLVLPTTEGLVLVDSGAVEAAPTLLATLAEVAPGARVRTLFNTHWHLDQVGGNEALGKAGAAIVAHEKTRLRLATDYFLPTGRYHPAAPLAAQPTESFYTTGETAIGGEHIEYGYLLEAHTDGDAFVFFRDANVIAVGDALSPERDPELDWFGGGWLGGRLDALELLLKITDAGTRFVPSYGPVVGRAAVQAERDLALLLFERFVDRIRKGESNEDMLAAGIMEGTGRTWSDPAKFVHDAHKGFWAHYNTLSHDIV
jgi:cyclase